VNGLHRGGASRRINFLFVTFLLDREAVWSQAKLVSIIPIRFKGMHYCYDDDKIRMLFSIAMFVFERNTRIRCRMHFGKAAASFQMKVRNYLSTNSELLYHRFGHGMHL
jgi:hypothetical protein